MIISVFYCGYCQTQVIKRLSTVQPLTTFPCLHDCTSVDPIAKVALRVFIILKSRQ